MDYKNYNPRGGGAGTGAHAADRRASRRLWPTAPCPRPRCPTSSSRFPADVKNGDIASNVAMAGARAFHKAPRQIAEAITDQTAAGRQPVRPLLRSPAPASSTCSWVPGLVHQRRAAPLSPTRNTAAPTAGAGKKL